MTRMIRDVWAANRENGGRGIYSIIISLIYIESIPKLAKYLTRVNRPIYKYNCVSILNFVFYLLLYSGMLIANIKMLGRVIL